MSLGPIDEAIGKWSDCWLLNPFPSMSEPEKAICYLPDYQDYDPDHLARLHATASLLEWPIATSSGAYRTWNGYSPYNPEMVVKLIAIFWVFCHYAVVGEDKKTPAIWLGLGQAPVKIENILSFFPNS